MPQSSKQQPWSALSPVSSGPQTLSLGANRPICTTHAVAKKGAKPYSEHIRESLDTSTLTNKVSLSLQYSTLR